MAVVAYLGPSLGGTYVYWRARREGEPHLVRWALRQSLFLYNAEHLALGAVLLTGIGLLWLRGWSLLWREWFRAKLAVLGGVLLPVEAWDLAVVHLVVARALAEAERSGRPVAAGALRAHHRVLTVGGALFTAAALAVLWLSVTQPGR